MLGGKLLPWNLSLTEINNTVDNGPLLLTPMALDVSDAIH